LAQLTNIYRYAGQVGYVFCSMRSVKEAQTGDTIFDTSKPVEALPGFSKAKPMVFAGKPDRLNAFST